MEEKDSVLFQVEALKVVEVVGFWKSFKDRTHRISWSVREVESQRKPETWKAAGRQSDAGYRDGFSLDHANSESSTRHTRRRGKSRLFKLSEVKSLGWRKNFGSHQTEGDQSLCVHGVKIQRLPLGPSTKLGEKEKPAKETEESW